MNPGKRKTRFKEVMNFIQEASYEDLQFKCMELALEIENSTRQVAREMGSRGGKKGGAARAKSLSPERRSEIAKKAAEARWNPK